MSTAVQNGRTLSLPTFGCEGCQRRKEQMMAGSEWQKDVLILLLVLGFAACIWKVKFPGNG